MAARSAGEDRARRQRLDYQPAIKPVPVAAPVPVSRPARKLQPATETAPVPVPDTDLLENCHNIQESLAALAGRYSLDSFTIATSDGLVFASSGSTTAQEDAASFGRNDGSGGRDGLALFSFSHHGSDLTGIIRSPGIITGEMQKGIENDTKDILNRWI